MSWRAVSRSPLWLLPISAIRKQGAASPMRWEPIWSPSVARRATATMRPWLSSRGSAMMRELSRALRSPALVLSAAERQFAFMAAVTGRFRSISPQPAIQRRKSPSVRTPWRMPLSETTKIRRDWLAVILLSADRMLSSAKTTNWVKFRSIRMPLTVLSATWVKSVVELTSDLCKRSLMRSAAAVRWAGGQPNIDGRRRGGAGASGPPGTAAPEHCSSRQWRWRLPLPTAVG